MRANILLNLQYELGGGGVMLGKPIDLPSILSLFAASLINSIIQGHEC